MGTKKERRYTETRIKKMKKGKRMAILYTIGIAFFGFLVFFFVSIFNMVYPPVSGTNGSPAKKEKLEMVLYFSDRNELFFVPEKRFIVKETDVNAQAVRLVRALIDGSKLGHISTFPDKTTLKGIKIGHDAIAQVNFSEDLIRNHPGGTTSEVATIYSLTNTLVRNIQTIRGVRIFVEDKPIVSIKGHVSTEEVFTPDRDLIVEGARNI